jgi:hypothetical protein
VPPQWAVKLMNWAKADNQSAQAEDEGLEPTKEWVKDLVDEIIAEEFASPDLELVWLSEEDNDLGKNEAALEALTRNEQRGALCFAPYANAATDRLMVLTATGRTPIEAGVGGEGWQPGWSRSRPRQASPRLGLLKESVEIRAVVLCAASGCKKSFEFIGFWPLILVVDL